jgi:hypothetical protein
VIRLRWALALGFSAALVGSVIAPAAAQASDMAPAVVNPPANLAYFVENAESGLLLWYDGSKFGTFGGTGTVLIPTSGQKQEYVDQNSHLCVTLHPGGNYLYEATCTNSTLQQWESYIQSDGNWLIKNVSDGGGYCLTQGPNPSSDPVGMQTCSGQKKQEWTWIELISYTPESKSRA